MAKPKRRYVCQACGGVSSRWQGQCPDCGEWNTLAEDAPQTVEKLLKAYLAHRSSPQETFLTFARRHDAETLRRLADAEVSP